MEDEVEPRGFDDFDLRIGDVMRGERATLGKSLLDVQRELKIKATYIAAIENADISAFETTGFIAGYVRSYARYLGLDPEWTFETFCNEAGFAPLMGMDKVGPQKGAKSGQNASVKGPVFRQNARGPLDADRDPIAQPRVSFAPMQQSAFSGIEPRAIGSTLVLLGLIGAIGYGGWSVLKEVQRVTLAPVDRAPEAVAQVDPLSGVRFEGGDDAPQMAGVDETTPDALDRLYRPQALEAPVMVARDGPIAALDPARMGALAGAGSVMAAPTGGGLTTPDAGRRDAITAAVSGVLGLDPAEPRQTPRVTTDVPEVLLVAVQPAWVRVRAADGTVLFERTLAPGDSWVVPATEEPPTLRTGAAGGIYFAVNGQTYGPAGPNGAVVDSIALNSGALTQEFALADPAASADAREAVAVAEAALFGVPEATPPTE